MRAPMPTLMQKHHTDVSKKNPQQIVDGSKDDTIPRTDVHLHPGDQWLHSPESAERNLVDEHLAKQHAGSTPLN